MFILSLFSRLPLRLLYLLSDVIAFLAYRVVRYRLRVVHRNICLCFPHISVKDQKRIQKGFYRHLADVIVEAVWFGGCNNSQRLRRQRMVEILNPEALCELSSDGRSMVILSSHLCNWELSGGILHYNYTSRPFPLSEQNYVVVYKKLSSPRWNRFMQKNRMAPVLDPEHFQGYIDSNHVLRYIVRHSHEQKFYNFITDQRPYKAAKGTLPVTFLGQQCQSMAAAAHLAQHYAFSVVYQRMLSTGRGHYTLEYVPICANAAETTAQEIMNRFYELLSADILSQPSQYLWSHKRFPQTNS